MAKKLISAIIILLLLNTLCLCTYAKTEKNNINKKRINKETKQKKNHQKKLKRFEIPSERDVGIDPSDDNIFEK